MFDKYEPSLTYQERKHNTMNTATVQQQNETLYSSIQPSDFLASTQKCIQEDGSLTLRRNEHYPQMIGFQFVASLVKPSTEVQLVKQLQDKQPEKPEDALECNRVNSLQSRDVKSKGE